MDAAFVAKVGEEVIPYGQADAESGTLTIQSSPAPTYTLYDASGAIVTGHNAQAVTGYDTAAGDPVKVWKSLDTSALAASTYVMAFKFKVQQSVDGLFRTRKPNVMVVIQEPYE